MSHAASAHRSGNTQPSSASSGLSTSTGNREEVMSGMQRHRERLRDLGVPEYEAVVNGGASHATLDGVRFGANPDTRSPARVVVIRVLSIFTVVAALAISAQTTSASESHPGPHQNAFKSMSGMDSETEFVAPQTDPRRSSSAPAARARATRSAR
jgi:hypothetical protein